MSTFIPVFVVLFFVFLLAFFMVHLIDRTLLARPKALSTCEFCRYQEQGACKRYPPGRVYTGDTSKDATALDVTVWPVVRMSDWCGDFRHDDRGKGPR